MSNRPLFDEHAKQWVEKYAKKEFTALEVRPARFAGKHTGPDVQQNTQLAEEEEDEEEEDEEDEDKVE